MKIEKYLEEVFIEKSIIKEYSLINHVPLYLVNEYDFLQTNIHGNNCTLMEIKSNRIISEKILKNLKKLNEIDGNKKILVFNELRSNQRKNLIKNRIAFIVPGKQIYLPFIYLEFIEKAGIEIDAVEKFTAAQQVVYLYILNQGEEVIPVELVKALDLSMSSVNRAIRQLVQLGLIIESGNATRKKYKRIGRYEYWEKGRFFLISPVQRVEYIKELPVGVDLFFSHDSALSKISMLNDSNNATYAVKKKEFKKIGRNLLLKDYELDSINYVRIEIWKYDPGLFSTSDIVDIFSLYAAYKGENDPRVDNELEELIKEELCED
jgi:DNA-binding MarR family transcriptional regulator